MENDLVIRTEKEHFADVGRVLNIISIKTIEI